MALVKKIGCGLNFVNFLQSISSFHPKKVKKLKSKKIMKIKIQFVLIAALALSASFLSCKKDKTSDADTMDLVTHSDDQSTVSAGTDEIADATNATIDSYNAFNGLVGSADGITGLPCNATAVLDSANGLRRITITFTGANCANTRTRTGVILLTMPLAQHWKDAGAVVTITAQNLKITRISDNKSITINGTILATNVSGGRLRDLASLGTIVHTITSTGVTVTFDNNTQRSWQIAKRRTFTSSNNTTVITTVGTHTEGSVTGISEWGTNRFGNDFITIISQPMVIREDCNWRLVSGQVTHNRLLANVVVTFGLDSAGNPVTCPSGSFYMKIVWTNANNVVRTYIIPY
jgi:hypothetical protein